MGILLISALFVIPNVTAILYGHGFKQTTLLSIEFSVSSLVGGILLSYMLDITPAGTIVLLSIAIFSATIGIRSTKILEKIQ